VDFFPGTIRVQFDAIAGRLDWDGPTPLPRGAPHRLLGDVDGILVSPPDRLDAELLSGAPRLRVISSVGTGIDHIDLAAATAGVSSSDTRQDSMSRRSPTTPGAPPRRGAPAARAGTPPA
jgi:phosphoglycerate dehydrogenase-like enzyme